MANPEYPWFPFYARDWLCDGDIVAMPLEAQGAYIRLICWQWENGRIPKGCAAVARILGVSDSHVANKLWEHIGPKFDNGKNPRLEEIRTEVIAERKRRKESARKAGKASAQKRQGKAVRTRVERPFNHPHPHPHPDEEKKTPKKESSSKRPAPGKGDDFPLISWNMLAERFDLPTVQKLTKARAAALRARLKEYPDFWERLAEELPKRSRWARDRRFPSFDQATREGIFLRLLEGQYRQDFDSKAKTLRQKNILPPEDDGPGTIEIFDPKTGERTVSEIPEPRRK